MLNLRFQLFTIHISFRNHPEAAIFESCTKDSLQCVTPGVYAMVGAAAALSGVTRLTGTLNYSILSL
jgi:hypothetical protein